MKQSQIIRIVIACLVLLYYLYYALHTTEWYFLDTVDLIFHEAGHTIIFFLGDFIRIAAGSLFQILIPTLCVVYFYGKEQYYSASLLLFWVGQNLINVSIYAGDAMVMQLPLLGGDGVIHDWNYLLSNSGLLSYTQPISETLYFFGTALFVVGFVFCIKNSRERV